ncbi:MAG: YidC/Oxa1 family membrane protein insertase [Patescibacteria group bacterium]
MFNTIFVEPLYKFFTLILNYFPDPGIAIIVFSLAVRIPLSPLYWILHKEEDKLKKIQALIKERASALAHPSNSFGNKSNNSNNKKAKVDFLKQAEIAAKVYEEEKFNPMSNFMIQMSPLPILFAMFAVFNKLKNSPEILIFMGIVDLKTPSVILAAITLVLQFISLRNQPIEMRKTAFFMIGIIGIILFTIPSIFIIYWIAILLWTLLEKKLFHWCEIKFAVKPISENNSNGS